MGSGSLGLMQATAGGRSGSEWKGGGLLLCVRQCFSIFAVSSTPHATTFPILSPSPPPPLLQPRATRAQKRGQGTSVAVAAAGSVAVDLVTKAIELHF